MQPAVTARRPRRCLAWRAFFYAGAPALLVSHWEVGSNAAVKITTWAELRANDKKWAPFVVVGEEAQ